MTNKPRPGRPPAANPREKLTVYLLPDELDALDTVRGVMDRSTAMREALNFWAASRYKAMGIENMPMNQRQAEQLAAQMERDDIHTQVTGYRREGDAVAVEAEDTRTGYSFVVRNAGDWERRLADAEE